LVARNRHFPAACPVHVRRVGILTSLPGSRPSVWSEAEGFDEVDEYKSLHKQQTTYRKPIDCALEAVVVEVRVDDLTSVVHTHQKRRAERIRKTGKMAPCLAPCFAVVWLVARRPASNRLPRAGRAVTPAAGTRAPPLPSGIPSLTGARRSRGPPRVSPWFLCASAFAGRSQWILRTWVSSRATMASPA
jgi:hypothetical protein